MEEVKNKNITSFEYPLKYSTLEYSWEGNLKKESVLILKAPTGNHTKYVDEYLSGTEHNTVLKSMIGDGLCFTKTNDVKVNEIMLNDLDMRDVIGINNRFSEVFFSI